MQLSNELRNRAILFVTSNDIERDSLISELARHSTTMRKKAIGMLSPLRVGVLSGFPVCLLSAQRGSHGKASVGMLLPEVLQTLRPKLVVLCGFCYGNPSSGELHDVIVSNRVVSLVDFVAKDGQLKLRSQPVLKSSIDDEKLAQIVGAITHGFGQEVKKQQLSSKIVGGTVYSGEIFSDDEAFVSELFQADPSAVGGDMEGQPVAAQANQRQIPWLFSKSPSDRGGGTTGTRNAQMLSARVAAIAACRLALEFLRTERLVAPAELLEYIGAEQSDPVIDLFDNVALRELRGTKEYAEKIRNFVERCSLDAAYDADFHSHLSAVLKEMAENSMKWGGSSRVQLRGDAAEIVLDSDGELFNPLEEFPKMKASGGGQRDLASFLECYGPSGAGLVKVSWRAENGVQSLTFSLNEVKADVRMNYLCTLLLTPEELRDYTLRDVPFNDFSLCTDVYLDATRTNISGSDGMLLSILCAKIPKKVARIHIRGVSPRIARDFKEHFAFDPRVDFV
jgi:nucleoside phosphorylase